MILFPNCKINLGLHITRKRVDGYHDLETIFYPLPLKDALESIRQQEPGGTDIIFNCTGLPVAGATDNNLCIKAYRLLKKDFPDLPAVQMHLHKTIPMGAGLGGGSADGAFTLRMLNQQFALNLSQQQLMDYALQLGSDCPFFILNKPCYATGRGENMQEIQLDLSGYYFVVVNPGIHISTAKAFSGIIPQQPGYSLAQWITTEPVENWKSFLFNDFEITVGKEYPQVLDIKQKLYDAGAVYASMSGSGSSVYGIFRQSQVPALNFPKDYGMYIIEKQ